MTGRQLEPNRAERQHGRTSMMAMDHSIIEASGLFDRSWYASAYRAMLRPDEDPLEHFLGGGADLHCRPNPLFDVAYYRKQAEALITQGNALLHYIKAGSKLNVNPHPLFDSVWYRRQLPSPFQRSPQTLLGHFLHIGRRLALTPNALFDDNYYQSLYPDVAAAGCDLLYHFEMWGEAEGRNSAQDVSPAALKALADAQGIDEDGAGNRVARIIERRPGVSFADLAATAAQFANRRLEQIRSADNADRSAVLMISHSLGGGVRRFVEHRAKVLLHENSVLILMAASGGFALRYRSHAHAIEVFIPAMHVPALLGILKDFHLSAIEIHHTYGFKDFVSLIGGLKAPIDLYLHDYFLVSPQPHLLGIDGKYVGDDLEFHHSDLERAAIVPESGTIRSWQRSQRWIFERARQVIVPSNDVGQRIRRIYPELELSVVPHEAFSIPENGRGQRAATPVNGTGRPRKVALIGYLQAHKGIKVARAVFDLARRRKLDLNFVIIGYCDDVGDLGPNVRVTGHYADHELEGILLDEAPDLVWFPAQCPETWSYTLTSALRLNLPVLCSDIGALAERIAGFEHGRTFPWDARPIEWLTCIMDQSRTAAGP
ncbi:glycosyltransferase [Methylobacterium mesophilicum]